MAIVCCPPGALPAEPNDQPKDAQAAPRRHSLFPDGSAKPTEAPKPSPDSSAKPSEAPKPSPTPKPKPSSDPESLQQEHPGFFVHADVDHASRRYEEGDNLVVSVTSEADAYIHMVYRQADGKVYQIFPNSGQRDNHIKAGETLRFPAEDGLFRWIVGPPLGKELIKVIASKQPLGRLSEAQLQQVRFNPVTAKDIETTRSELGQKKEAWSEDQVEITTVVRGQTPAPAGGRRFAVFSGVGKYEFNDVIVERAKEALKKAGKWKEGDPEPAGWDVRSPPNNAEVMERLFRRYGQVTESQRHVNQEATRQGIKASIEWLKEVSRPGDTVFIYHCGHGGRFPEDPRDDRTLPAGTKPFYMLFPYDYADFGVLDGLSGRKSAGTLDPAQEPRFKKMLMTAFPDGKIPGKDEQAWMAVTIRLINEFCVTADEFGHWIQMLDGRQVVVILEICHAGGFATHESEGWKGVGGDKGFVFDFLGPQLGRLKDIGQPESALLAACSAHESALSTYIPDDELKSMIAEHRQKPRRGLDVGLATALFCEAMVDRSSPFQLDTSFEEWLQQRAKQHCDLLNQAIPPRPDEESGAMRPRLFNYCSRVIVLKP
jgi:hypothetical protein